MQRLSRSSRRKWIFRVAFSACYLVPANETLYTAWSPWARDAWMN